MKAYIEEKAFEISTTTIERVSDFSSFALLERTYENRISLNDLIKKIELSNINGIVGISIYQREKDNGKFNFNYLAGFGPKDKKFLQDKKLLDSLNNSTKDSIISTKYLVKHSSRVLNTYRFIKPIIIIHKGHTVLLGIAILYYDKSAINIVISEMISLVFQITFTVLLLAILFVYFIGVRLTKPVLQITKAAEEISKGNLNIDLQIHTNDEIEQLANQFNKMVYSLQEHEKIQKFVSASTINMIQKNSTQQPSLGGGYKILAFLFCDIRGFTTLSEKKEPSEVINIVNFYLNLQSNIIKANDGDIDKFIGDEIMASFSEPNATQKALNSAIEIQLAITKANIQRVKNNETICEVGIGINHGRVVVGNIGSHDRMDFTSVGSVVNIASRLCSIAEAGKIIIEKNSYDTSNAKYKVNIKTPLLLKGIGEPLDTYYVFAKEE